MLHEILLVFRPTVTGGGLGRKQCEWGGRGLVGCAGWMQVSSLRVRSLRVQERFPISQILAGRV